MKKRIPVILLLLSLVAGLSACAGFGFGGGSGIKTNPKGVPVTYALGGFVVKSPLWADYLADPDTMTAAQKLIYEGYVASFGGSVKISGSDITFGGAAVAEFSPAKYTQSGADIVFAHEELNGFFSFVTLENGVFSLGMAAGGSGYVLEYYSPKYVAPSFKLLFNYNGATGGDAAEEQKVQLGKAVGELPVPTRAGYTFSGWRPADAAATLDKDAKYIWKGDTVAVAQWTANSYLIAYYYDGATGGNTAAQKTVVYGAAVGALPAPVKPGFDFDGWFTGISGTGTAVTSATVWNIAGDAPLYAKWIVSVNYIISFDLSAGTGMPPAPQSISQTAGLTYPPIPERSGFIFAGWYDNAACTGNPFNFAATVTQSRTLYAKWLQPTGHTGVISAGGGISGIAFNYTVKYYAFVPLVSGDVVIYSTSSGGDPCGFLFDSSKYQLAYNDDDYYGYGLDFRIDYTVTAGTLYYIGFRSLSSSSSSMGTGALFVTGAATPPAGGTRA